MAKKAGRTLPAPDGKRGRGLKAREALMDAAERVFAEEGASASLRRIMVEAGVNAAAINYHFGTRRALLQALLERRIDLITSERLQLLADAEALPQSARLEAIIRALLEPTFREDRRKNEGWRRFLKVQAHLRSQPTKADYSLAAEPYDEQHLRFIKAIARACPRLSKKEIYFRYHCVLSIIIQSYANPYRIYDLSGGVCDLQDFEALKAWITPILTGILAAPPRSISVRKKRARAGRAK